MVSKTVSTLTAIQELMHDRFEVSRVLVIAPLRVAQDTWPREMRKWDHLHDLTYSKILGTAKQRLAGINQPADIYLINRENIPWLVKHWEKDWPYDMIVIDESSSFKNPSSQRFKALRKVRQLSKRVVQLTGTPAPQGPMDLWSQLYLLDRGERLGKTLTGYRNDFFNPGRRNRSVIYEWIPKPGAEAQIKSLVSDICFSMTAEDWLEMPERIDNIIKIDLPEKAKKAYAKLEQDLVMRLGDGVIAAPAAAVLGNKLLQLANGAAYDDEKRPQHLHDAKLDALEEIVEGAQPLLVYYSYRHDLFRILERFPEARTLKTEVDIADWNAGKIPLLLAHPASAGHGLNLQDGGHHICWFGLPWSLELYQQANARLHRQGQKEAVIIHHLIADGTIDEQVVGVLEGKDETQRDLIEAVKARIEIYRRNIA